MRAIRVAEYDQTRVLMDDGAPQPKPGASEVLIRVAAAGIVLAELSWYPTSHKKTGEPRIRAIPGHEFSGLVADVVENVGEVAGRAVFGMNDWFSDGAMAEFCTAPYFAITPKPSSLSLTQAAAVPMSALTAWQALSDHAKLLCGETISIHGGAVAVGAFAIQFARDHLRIVLADRLRVAPNRACLATRQSRTANYRPKTAPSGFITQITAGVDGARRTRTAAVVPLGAYRYERGVGHERLSFARRRWDSAITDML